MTTTVVHLELTFDEKHVRDCALALRQRLPPDQYRVLAQLAAEIVADWETATSGSRVLVVPMVDMPAELARAAKAAGLPTAEG